MTDLLISDKDHHNVILSDYDLCLSINSYEVPLLEIIMDLRDELHQFKNWIEYNKSLTVNTINFRDIESLRLVMEYDMNGNIIAQFGKYFIGLHRILCYSYDLASLKYTETANITDICKTIKYQDLLDSKVQEMLKNKCG